MFRKFLKIANNGFQSEHNEQNDSIKINSAQIVDSLTMVFSNNTGATIEAGAVVTPDPNNANSIRKATLNTKEEADLIGVAKNSISNGNFGEIVIKGKAPIFTDDSPNLGESLFLVNSSNSSNKGKVQTISTNDTKVIVGTKIDTNTMLVWLNGPGNDSSLFIPDVDTEYHTASEAGFIKPKGVIADRNTNTGTNREYIYTLYHTNPGAVSSFNIRNPTAPQLLNEISTGNGPNAAVLRNTTLFVVTNSGTLYAVDVSNPKNLSKNSTGLGNNNQRFGVDIDSSGDYVYIAGTEGDGLEVVDVTDLTNMNIVASIGFNAGDVKVIENYAYLTDFSNAELVVIDVSNPSNPTEIKRLSIGNFPVAIQKQESKNLLAVSEFNAPNIYFVDISTKNNPQILSSVQREGQAGQVGGASKFFNKNVNLFYAFSGVKNDNGGILSIFDISDINNPQLKLKWKVLDAPKEISHSDISLDNRYLYIGIRDDSINQHDTVVMKNPLKMRLSFKSSQLIG